MFKAVTGKISNWSLIADFVYNNEFAFIAGEKSFISCSELSLVKLLIGLLLVILFTMLNLVLYKEEELHIVFIAVTGKTFPYSPVV